MKAMWLLFNTATYGISRISWQGDPCAPQSNLSSSGLTGTIAAGIQNLTQLEILDLSNNNLTGELPEFLSNMKSLVFISSGSSEEGLELFPQGNPRLCASGSCLPPKTKPFPVAIVASVASALATIIAVLALIFIFRKKKPDVGGNVQETNSKSYKFLMNSLLILHAAFVSTALQPPPSTPPVANVTYADSPVSSSVLSIQTNKRRFTYSEVINMTNNFQRVVGKGGFGVVYHGTLNGYEQVAVKVLSQSSTQGYKQFRAEVDLLMRVHHANLVNLVGYCSEGDHLALIYEFVPNGDLRQHLSAVEAALGLEYLHSGCIPPMIHRDVKTTNILLDEQFKAKLADFGLSRSFPVGGESHVSTKVAGTPGYLDPEYYRTSRLTEKSDVYSFGIVLLETITNEPVIDQASAKTHITQ
ncbi:hypothetical protein Bca101_001168 [Brassica carinata]